jgi:hypothetical protein
MVGPGSPRLEAATQQAADLRDGEQPSPSLQPGVAHDRGRMAVAPEAIASSISTCHTTRAAAQMRGNLAAISWPRLGAATRALATG